MPGTPINTAGKVSEVVVGAKTPIIIARACDGSRAKTNGRTRARPEVPPRPVKFQPLSRVECPQTRKEGGLSQTVELGKIGIDPYQVAE